MLDHRRVRAVTAVKYLPQRCKFSASTSSHRIHRVQRRKSIVGQIRARFLTSSLAKSIFTPFSAKLTSWAGSLAAKLRVWEAMSFLRHREIYQSDERQERGGALTATPPLIVLMSFQLAIPWRVALQQSSPPLHQLGMILAKEEHDGKSRFGSVVRSVKPKLQVRRC